MQRQPKTKDERELASTSSTHTHTHTPALNNKQESTTEEEARIGINNI